MIARPKLPKDAKSLAQAVATSIVDSTQLKQPYEKHTIIEKEISHV